MIGRVSGRVTGLGKAFLLGQAQADIEDSRESSGFGQVQRGQEGPLAPRGQRGGRSRSIEVSQQAAASSVLAASSLPEQRATL